MRDGWWGDLIISIILCLLFFALCFAFFVMVKEAFSEKIEITKSNWHCTGAMTETVLMPIGKVLVPQQRTSCVKYERDGETK